MPSVDATARVLVGIKILVSDLLEQTNEKNINIIKKILKKGYIENDEGSCFTEYVNQYIESTEELLKRRTFVDDSGGKNNGKNNGKSRVYNSRLDFNNIHKKTSQEYLKQFFKKYLLVPENEICYTCITACYNTGGFNCSSGNIDTNIGQIVKKYCNIKKFKIVNIVTLRA